MKLSVYQTVKKEVTNVECLSRDLPLNNSAIRVKWEWLKLLYSSKGCVGLTVNKKIDTFEIYSVGIL